MTPFTTHFNGVDSILIHFLRILRAGYADYTHMESKEIKVYIFYLSEINRQSVHDNRVLAKSALTRERTLDGLFWNRTHHLTLGIYKFSFNTTVQPTEQQFVSVAHLSFQPTAELFCVELSIASMVLGEISGNCYWKNFDSEIALHNEMWSSLSKALIRII